MSSFLGTIGIIIGIIIIAVFGIFLFSQIIGQFANKEGRGSFGDRIGLIIGLVLTIALLYYIFT